MKWRKLLLCLEVGLIACMAMQGAKLLVRNASEAFISPELSAFEPRYTGIILGCRVNGEEVSGCLEERLERGLALYKGGQVQRLLVTGDHGHAAYDEVNAMKDWLLVRGVPAEHVFMDHAGFDTYDSMWRAREVFAVGDAVVVSQAFHLPRAVYLARSLGIDAVGSSADPDQGSVCRGSSIREPLARLKAVLNVLTNAAPHHAGPPIPITGPSSPSYDRP